LDWLPWAAEEFLSGDDSLRQFLWTFGADVKEGRAAFAPLVTLALRILNASHDLRGIAQLASDVATAFPHPDEARNLKIGLFGEKNTAAMWAEEDILLALGTVQRAEAFDVNAVRLSERAETLLQRDRSAAYRLVLALLNAKPNPSGDKMLTALAGALTIRDARELAASRPSVAEFLLVRAPILFTTPELWKSISGEASKLLDKLVRSHQSDLPSLCGALSGLLSADLKTLELDAVSRIPDKALSCVLDWIQDAPGSHPQLLAPVWLNLLAERSTLVLDWLENISAPTPAIISLLPHIFDPTSDTVAHQDASLWLRLADGVSAQGVQSRRRPEFLAFTLALSLQNPPGPASELAARAFEPVHEALRIGDLSEHVWEQLKRHLPALEFRQRWDRCERLRRGYVEAAVRFGWPVDTMINAVEDRDTRERLGEHLCHIDPAYCSRTDMKPAFALRPLTKKRAAPKRNPRKRK
jgi:hypothetical protein